MGCLFGLLCGAWWGVMGEGFEGALGVLSGG